MRKLIASVALVTAVAVGGLAVAAVNPLNIVSAKSSGTSTTAADPGSGKAKAKSGARHIRAAKLLDQALAGVVKNGTITKAQAVAVKQAIQDTAKEFRAEHKGQKGQKGAALRKSLRRGVVKTSATAIGVAPKDLVAGLKSGKSISQIAQAKGVDPKTVVTAIVTAGNSKVDAAVTAGKIDAARAAKIKQRLPELATKVVNRVPRNRTN